MKIPGRAVLFALLLAVPAAALAQPTASQPDYTAIGRETVTSLSQHQWSAVEARFDQRMKAALPPDKLSAAWNQLISQAGPYRKIETIHVIQKDVYHVAIATCAFTNASMEVRVTVDAAGNIAGLFFTPPQAVPSIQSSTAQPDYSAIGQQAVTLLSQQKWSALELQFDQRMQAALPSEKLASAWSQLSAQAGPFEKIEKVTVVQHQTYNVAVVACTFARGAIDVRVTVDPAGRIAGLFFVPAS